MSAVLLLYSVARIVSGNALNCLFGVRLGRSVFPYNDAACFVDSRSEATATTMKDSGRRDHKEW